MGKGTGDGDGGPCPGAAGAGLAPIQLSPSQNAAAASGKLPRALASSVTPRCSKQHPREGAARHDMGQTWDKHGTARRDTATLPCPARTHSRHQPGPAGTDWDGLGLTGMDWDGGSSRPTQVVAALVRHLDVGGPGRDLGDIHISQISCGVEQSQGRARAGPRGHHGGTEREGTGQRGLGSGALTRLGLWTVTRGHRDPEWPWGHHRPPPPQE